jgi:hypothetical protein
MLIAARFDDGTGLSDQEIRDEVMTMFAAGYDRLEHSGFRVSRARATPGYPRPFGA